jgi:hypothetical protein
MSVSTSKADRRLPNGGRPMRVLDMRALQLAQMFINKNASVIAKHRHSEVCAESRHRIGGGRTWGVLFHRDDSPLGEGITSALFNPVTGEVATPWDDVPYGTAEAVAAKLSELLPAAWAKMTPEPLVDSAEWVDTLLELEAVIDIM